MTANSSLKVVAETPFIRLVQRGRWVFAQRPNATGVVCVVAITPAREIVLVEQHRPPLNARVIELPAGLAGDLSDHSDESLTEAARRELYEETGYVAERFEQIIDGASSAGLTDEIVTMFLAQHALRTGPGGGDGSEEITVHAVPLEQTQSWLLARRSHGTLVDFRVYAGLLFARDIAGDDIAEDDIAEDDIAEDDIAEDDIAEDDIAEDDIAEDDVAEDDVERDEDGGDPASEHA